MDGRAFGRLWGLRSDRCPLGPRRDGSTRTMTRLMTTPISSRQTLLNVYKSTTAATRQLVVRELARRGLDPARITKGDRQWRECCGLQDGQCGSADDPA